MTPQEREARLRAARRLQDDIYQGIGATDRPDVDGRGPTSAAGGRMRDEARDSATSMTRAGTQPLRDLLAQPDDRTARMAAMDADEDDSQVMGKPGKMGSGKGRTRVDIGPVTVDPPARSMAAPQASDDEREAREDFRQWQRDRAAQRRARAAGDVPKRLNRMDD